MKRPAALTVLFLVCAFNVIAFQNCSPTGSGTLNSIRASAEINYQKYGLPPAPDGSTTEDLAYVDFAKSRLIVPDFQVCWRVVPLTNADVTSIRNAMNNTKSNQASAMSACNSASSSGSDAYRVLFQSAPEVTTETYAVCGTNLQTVLDSLRARPGTYLCN